MSLHVSPSHLATSAAGHDAGPGPEAAGTALPDAIRALHARTLLAKEGPGLAVHLPHMGLLLALTSPPDESKPTSRQLSQPWEGGFVFHFEPTGTRTPGGSATAQSPRGAVPQIAPMGDPIVQQLSRALEAAGNAGDGLHADALRLALVARMLVIQAETAQDIRQAPRPVPASRRGGPGLVTWRLKRVLAFMEEHLPEPITLADMAAAAGLSRMHFAAQFRIATGLRPHEYLLRSRIERAKQLMRETREPLVQVALGVGFQTQAHFTTVFRRFTGETPYQWRCAAVAA